MFEVVIYERVFLSFSVLINSVFPSLQIYMIATDSRGKTPIERQCTQFIASKLFTQSSVSDMSGGNTNSRGASEKPALAAVHQSCSQS